MSIPSPVPGMPTAPPADATPPGAAPVQIVPPPGLFAPPPVWTVTDLDATNGVIVVAADGSELLLDPGATAPVGERLRLGRVGMRRVATEDVVR